jgi:hypothetical protein
MAYRYTNTEKWNDSWFSNLKPNEKLLFIYLYENCDIAGFVELNIKRWSTDLGYDKKIIEGALKGLQRGLIHSILNDCIYIRTFLKHQKNLPLNPEKNMAHRGIIKRFDVYKNKFNIQNIIEFIEGASKGLGSPYGNGIGNGIGNGNGKGKEEEKTKINFQFEDFWNLYDKKVGDKDKISKKWQALTDPDRAAAINYIPGYIASRPDKQFRKDPTTFLNNKSWNDEIIQSNPKIKSTHGIPEKERNYTEPETF